MGTSTSNHDTDFGSGEMEDGSSTYSEGETDTLEDTLPVPVPVNSIEREKKHNILQGFLSQSVTHMHLNIEEQEEEEFSSTEKEETDLHQKKRRKRTRRRRNKITRVREDDVAIFHVELL